MAEKYSAAMSSNVQFSDQSPPHAPMKLVSHRMPPNSKGKTSFGNLNLNLAFQDVPYRTKKVIS